MVANFLIQTYASVVRIEKYLGEDEIPEWVSWQSESRLGSTINPAEPFDDRVGFSDASFAWVSPNKEEEKKPAAAAAKPPLMTRIKGIFKKAPTPANDTEAVADAADEEAEEDKPFELRNIDVKFKIGAINLVSGPTGSGKSSRQCPFHMTCGLVMPR